MFATSNRKTWKQGKNLSATTRSSVATATSSHKSEINWPWSQGQVHTALITQVIQTIPHRPDNTDMMTLIILVTLRVSSWSQEGNKSAEIGSSKVTGNEWYHFSRFSAGNFPKIRMLPGGCVSCARHPFLRRGSGRCWCCPQHFVGAAPPHLGHFPQGCSPSHPFQSPLWTPLTTPLRLLASSIWKTLFSSSSNVRLLFFEAGSFWAVW